MENEMNDYKIGTKCVQAGYTPENGQPRQIPIIQSTTFKYSTSEDMGKLFDLEASGYFYTRLQNPTNDAVAAKICDLEGGAAAMLTSSGQEIHGHEFHYWESEDPGTDWEAVKPTGNRSWRCIHEKGGQIGGFPHLYYASCPDFLRKWLDECAKGSQQKYTN